MCSRVDGQTAGPIKDPIIKGLVGPSGRRRVWTGWVEQARSVRVWTAIDTFAREEGVAPSVRHAVLACVQLLAAAGAGLSILRDGGLREPVLATGPGVEELEELQFTLGQGPCTEVVAGGGPVLVS